MTAYIDAYRNEFGVEPICTTLQVAPSTYYAAKSRPVAVRSLHDAVLIPVLVAIWMANFRVYGVQKLWKAARRSGHDIDRDQVARLMRIAGIEGVVSTEPGQLHTSDTTEQPLGGTRNRVLCGGRG